jgi:hypothetical protein
MSNLIAQNGLAFLREWSVAVTDLGGAAVGVA